MKKIVAYIRKIVTSRIFMAIAIVSLQILFLYLGVAYLIQEPLISTFVTILESLLVIHVVNRDANTSYKLLWIVIIYAIPVIGSVIYFLFAEKKVPRSLRVEITKSLKKSEGLLIQNESTRKKLTDLDVRQQFDYVSNNAYFPYYQNTKCKYFTDGISCFNDMLDKVKHAKRFIFMEYFIVKDGEMLEMLFDALVEKRKQGVEIYFMYDDGGSIASVPDKFKEFMNKNGIHCIEFSPVNALLSLLFLANYRDHRKLCVIDNEYGYVGGFNIGDEYIDKQVRFGRWKDSGLRIEGDAVDNLTIMFIQFYNAMAKKAIKYTDYLRKHKQLDSDSFVLPFSDSPSDNENVGRNVHMNLITHAKKYVYISTPYLILDYDMTNALITAAKNGVEVIINVPHIPDKKSVFMVTRSNYDALVDGGVRVFEYTPGFMHSKNVISDDKIALVGSINMDYRSYYLNYECGALITGDKEIRAIKKDYLNCISESHEITKTELINTSFFTRFLQHIMNLISPLF